MNIIKTIYAIIAVVILNSCNNSTSSKSANLEFDIPTFIIQESQRLQDLNPIVTKTVVNGKYSETKLLKISNWSKELSHFISIDLNKSGEFSKKIINDTVVYNNDKNPKTTLTVKVIYSGTIPIEVDIVKHTKNLLFENEEILQYQKDKTYSIAKKQHVKGMGSNNYFIKGEF